MEGVRVLNGGYAGWVAEGRPIETGPGREVVAGSFTATPGSRGQVDGATLARRLDAGEPVLLVDVRAGERYRGEVEPMDPVAGHIPGALSLPSTENLDPAGRFRPASVLAERFAGLGDGPVLYCGSGVTAAHTLLALTVAGTYGGRRSIPVRGATGSATRPGRWPPAPSRGRADASRSGALGRAEHDLVPARHRRAFAAGALRCGGRLLVGCLVPAMAA